LKKQVLLLSALVWGLVLFAPFTGDSRFCLAPWFDAGAAPDVSRSGSPARVAGSTMFRPETVDLSRVLPDAASVNGSIAASGAPAPSMSDPKLPAFGSDPVYLSMQGCQQNITHPCLQECYGTDGLEESSPFQGSDASIQMSNREPIQVSRGDEYTGSPRTPKSLPPTSGNAEGRQHSPGDAPQFEFRGEEVSPGSPYNECKPPCPGPSPSPTEMNPSVAP
jgi:hypothetical protein